MKSPEPFDNEGYIETLGRGNKEEFRKLFNKKHSNIDVSRAIDAYRTTFDSEFKSRHQLFKDIVNCFTFEGYEYELTIIDPLHEFGDSRADILLAKKHPQNVHLCFIFCEAVGENFETWIENINKTYELMDSSSNRRELLEHIRCPSSEIRSTQYVTLTKAQDLVDANRDLLFRQVDPDEYAVWKRVESGNFGEDDKEIVLDDGSISNYRLQELIDEGIDVISSTTSNVEFGLKSHPVFPIREICLQLYLDRDGDGDDNPEEFFSEDFADKYWENTIFGENRDTIESFVEDEIEYLLDKACEYNILQDDPDELNDREYRIRWQTEQAADIKDMVKDKFFKGNAPEKMGRLAFKRAKNDFETDQYDLDDFDY